MRRFGIALGVVAVAGIAVLSVVRFPWTLIVVCLIAGVLIAIFRNSE